MSDIFDNFLHLDRDGVLLGTHKKIHIYSTDRLVEFNEHHPVYVIGKAIETAAQDYPILMVSCLVPELRTLGHDVIAYFQTRLCSMTSFEHYVGMRIYGPWYINLYGSNGGCRVALSFMVVKEEGQYLISDVNRIDNDVRNDEDLWSTTT